MSSLIEISPNDLIARAVDTSFPAFRIVKAATRRDPRLLDSLRSNYESRARPRGLEVQSALIHMGLSMYESYLLSVGDT